MDGQSPDVFVSYVWRCSDCGLSIDCLSQEREAHLGKTEVARSSSNPRWNHAAQLRLPSVTRDGERLLYPAAFRDLVLELHVWHQIDSTPSSKRNFLIGIAHVELWPLAPPKSATSASMTLQSGVKEVNGYFHVKVASRTSRTETPDAESEIRGQIHASILPTTELLGGLGMRNMWVTPALNNHLRH